MQRLVRTKQLPAVLSPTINQRKDLMPRSPKTVVELKPDIKTTKPTSEAVPRDVPPQFTGEFEGQRVLATAAKITRAGDGLSASLKTDPIDLHSGEEVIVVLRCKVGDIAFRPRDVDDPAMGMIRLHTLVTQECVIAQDELVDTLDTALLRQARRNRERKEREQGINHLDLDLDETDDVDLGDDD
jgi:hypothetical protein